MIGVLPHYTEMKDSGVPWLGQVPRHWEVAATGRLGTIRKGNGGNKQDEVPSGIPCVRYGDLYTRHEFFIRSTKAFVTKERAPSYTPIQRGDVLFAASGETHKDIGRSAVNLIDGDSVCGGDILVLRPTRKVLPEFLGYAADSPPARSQKTTMGRGFTVVHVYASQIKNLVLPLPPLPEQAAIVRFLDYADRRIRRYIRAKQKLIKLLEEQKQAIIHRAVTRGLDPDVRLKPSGVEWLGEVPEHWEVTRLHQITDPVRPIMYGIVLPGPNVDEGVFIIKGGNCEPGRLQPEFLSRTTFDIESRYARARLKARDIVFAIRGGVGAAAIVPDELEGANLTQDAARIAPREDLDPRWLFYAVRAPIFQEHVSSRVVGATVRGVNIRDLKRIAITLPPATEQAAIAEYLEAALQEVSAASTLAESEIALLHEYRTRLIADVVTGKLDVREAAAQLPAKTDADNLDEDTDALADDAEAEDSSDMDAELEQVEA